MSKFTKRSSRPKVSRREAMGITASMVGAAGVAGSGLILPGCSQETSHGTLFEPGREIPILTETEVLVLGGGPAGMSAALAAAREAAFRLQAAGEPVKVIALRLLLPASPDKLAAALAGVERVLVVEQSHGRQFQRYLRAFYDIDAEIASLARPGPLPITPGEIVEHIENWS